MLKRARLTEQQRLVLVAEQVRALYLQAPISNLTVCAVSLLYFFALRSRLDADLLLAWTGLMWGAAGYRLSLWHRYRRQGFTAPASLWLRRYTLASLWIGGAWSLIVLFLADMSDHIVVAALSMLVFGVTSSAVAILSMHLPSFLVYVYPQILVLGAMLLSQQVAGLTILTVALCGYLLMLTLLARNAHRLFASHVYLANENQDLVTRLNAENARRETVIQERTRALSETNLALKAEIAERKKAEESLRQQERSLRRLAHHDPLTALPNRLLMIDRLGQAIRRAHRTGTGLAVLFIDLDHFKEINDSLGHSVGDAFLKAVAKRLVQTLRAEDTVARLGGDEFVVIAEQVQDSADASAIADLIQGAFKAPFEVGLGDFGSTLSIGISLYPADGVDTETLLRNADAAMYRAKSDGRNAYRFYAADMTEKARVRVEMEAALRQALDGDAFRLLFQPQFELSTGRLIGAEALIRWEHPTQGLLLPASFIPMAESTGQIEQIGTWVLEEACSLLARWERAGMRDLVLAVNVSGRQFLKGDLVDRIQAILQGSGCDPRRLELEITEGFLIRRPERARAMLQEIREMGIRIVIDDFGTGYSSLSHLKAFPISKIKIDLSFVRDVTSSPNDQAIATAIVALGRSFGLSVIAEGVETPEQAEFLGRCGCDQAQGFLYSRPLSESAFIGYWKTQQSQDADVRTSHPGFGVENTP
ncbi:EAL domain-containing protein [Thiorhodococcus mannitoliphagus]|uniref:cyclic-guanylate-specific phosphodiesterase n=1 Tax=Thiorhodococcus mannitoliphagus TaxID=329406 RepID=A0A6P1DZW9_9GAMM|nr:EAL domain-containing protein [Thiorhodococcus mannitoliphagus]NEX22583.1 EAL domain-containing protein [Thiorhodococcus mannitoliphagus]